MRKFHPLTVAGVATETADSVRVALHVPDELMDAFRFLPGQHLPVQATVDGKSVRRTYSICSSPGQLPLELGIRVQQGGVFSEKVAMHLQSGDEILVMPPFGQFHPGPETSNEGDYLAFAAGSGITPILSIMRAVLETDSASRFVLFYSNRKQSTTMFIDDLQALKNRFPERLQLYFLFSREEQEFPIFHGRLDRDKTASLLQTFCGGLEPCEAFVCGPDTMIASVMEALLAHGMDAGSIHAERYGAPRKVAVEPMPAVESDQHQASVTVIMDGHRKGFSMPAESDNIVDAAADAGIELPYSCKGGVCATCRTLVVEGEVAMQTNYGLEPWEVEKGYVLACQSRPLSKSVTLDYDQT